MLHAVRRHMHAIDFQIGCLGTKSIWANIVPGVRHLDTGMSFTTRHCLAALGTNRREHLAQEAWKTNYFPFELGQRHSW